MPVLSAALKAAVDPQVTKVDWSSTAKTLLTNTRRLEGWWISNAASDPTTGTKFLDVGSIGELPVTAGNISGFGTLTGVTTRAAANLATGAAALVLRGNGHTITYTLGLPGSGKEFVISSSPTGAPNEGFAFAIGAGMKAPTLLDSGTGPLSPIPDASTAAAFRLVIYPNGVRTIAGTASFSKRDPNMVMDIPWMASEMGDIRKMRTPDGGGVVVGTGGDAFIFAGTLLMANKVVNGEANVPLQQVEIRAKPHGRWASFPFRKDFDIDNDTLIPPAHKVEILNAAGNIIDVIEMYSTRDVNNTPGSGLPVNDPSLNNDYTQLSTKPIQPWWNCLMVHQWWSHRPKYHSKRSHLIPSVGDETLHPTNTRNHFSDNMQWPLITLGGNSDGLGAYKICPKWSRAQNGTFDTTILDTSYVNIQGLGIVGQIIGYGFEPGSSSKHTWYMSPGGTRHDRSGWPHIVVRWITLPNGSRLHGSVPHTDLLHHYLMGYANHSQHYFTDVTKGLGIPKSKVLNGEICYNDTYYRGGNENFRPDIENNAVRLLSAVNKANAGFLDKYGRHFTNEWGRDIQHTYSSSAIGAYTYVSPAHVRLARHSFTAHVLAAFDMTQAFDYNSFLCREHAWHNWQLANMWIVGNNDEDGFTTLEIEGMWGKHLELVYDAIYTRYTSGTDLYSVCLRRLGLGMKPPVPDVNGKVTIEPITDSKAFYFAQVFLLMKQSGSWAKMQSYSPKCAAILDIMLKCLGEFAVGMFVDANGRGDKASEVYPNPRFSYNIANPVYPQTWADVFPAQGGMTWLRTSDGSLTQDGSDQTNTMHFRAQYLRVLKDFFPEYSIPRLDQAISIMNAFYAEVAQNGAPINPDVQFNYRFDMMGLFNKTTVIGPSALS